MKKLFSVLFALSLLLCLTSHSVIAKSVGSGDGSLYYGEYIMPETNMLLQIQKDATFKILDSNGKMLSAGFCSFENGLTLVDKNGEVTYMVLDEMDNLYCKEIEKTFYRNDPNLNTAPDSSAGKTQSNADSPYGFYESQDMYLTVNPDGTFRLLEKNKALYALGTFEADNEGLTLTDENGEITSLQKKNTAFHSIKLEQTFSKKAETMAELFQGYWMYDDGSDNVILIDRDLWIHYDDEGRLVGAGPTMYDQDQVVLHSFTSDKGGGFLKFDDNGNLKEFDRTLVYMDGFPLPKPEYNPQNIALKGKWIYGNSENQIIYFDGLGNYFQQADEYFSNGLYDFDGENIIFRTYGEEGSNDGRLDKESGQLFVTGEAGSFYTLVKDRPYPAPILD